MKVSNHGVKCQTPLICRVIGRRSLRELDDAVTLPSRIGLKGIQTKGIAMYRSVGCSTQGARAGLAGSASALVIVMFEKVARLPTGYAKLDWLVNAALSTALRRAEFSAARGKISCLYPEKGVSRVYILGLGRREKFGQGEALRAAGAQLTRAACAAKVKHLHAELIGGLDGALDEELAGRAFGEGLGIGNFEFGQFKGTGSEKVAYSAGGHLSVSIDRSMRKGLERSLRTCESVNVIRRLAATPPNVAKPAHLVAFCRRIAKQVGLRCTVIDAKRALRLKMGGLLAVGSAGSNPPAMICLEWCGKVSKKQTGPSQQPPIMLVGKAVTFDTGGYSIKPAAGMESMKYDKCGAMAVIGAMHAVARLKLPRRVVALIPTAENMISEKAYRPSDILRMYNGVTVEITNTDAEGRLLLADAISYGCKRYKPSAVIDLATLTGGVIVALGTECAGMFCRQSKLRSLLFDAAEQTGERLWHLPLWDEHKLLLKSDHADIVNSGGREAHAIQGAAFLSYFIDKKTPWAHLDIAGVSDVKQNGELYIKGPTGYGVRLLVRAIETWR